MDPKLHSLYSDAKKSWMQDESQQIVGVKAMFTDLKTKFFKMRKETDFTDLKPESLMQMGSFFKKHQISPLQSTKFIT